MEKSVKNKSIYSSDTTHATIHHTFGSLVPTTNHIVAPTTAYEKFLPEVTPELHKQFLQATGRIEYSATIDYMFLALFQENKEALSNLICSILHWDQSMIKSIEIVNPIALGKYIESKTFILDIKVLLNDNTIINLEMQLNNYHNWPARSLGYLCRSFDNLNAGNDYIETKPVIHIGFLDFTLFPDMPEFHATYKLQNIKNHNIYTDKFVLHVIELNHINLATEEDRLYEIDTWASFFKATTWEDIHMLIDNNLTLESAAETLYQLNMNPQLRENLDRFMRAEARQNALNRINAELTQKNEELTLSKLTLTQTIAEKDKEITAKDSIIADNQTALAKKDSEIAALMARLEELEKNNFIHSV